MLLSVFYCVHLNSICDSHLGAIAMISCRKPVKGSICLGLFLYTFKSFLQVFSLISGGAELHKNKMYCKHLSYSSLYPAQVKSRATSIIRVKPAKSGHPTNLSQLLAKLKSNCFFFFKSTWLLRNKMESHDRDPSGCFWTPNRQAWQKFTW